jgi:hypothetical protein
MKDSKFSRARAAVQPGRRARILTFVMLLLAATVWWMSQAGEILQFPAYPTPFATESRWHLPAALRDMPLARLVLALLMMLLTAIVFIRMKSGALAPRTGKMLAGVAGAAACALVAVHFLTPPPAVYIDDGCNWAPDDPPGAPDPVPPTAKDAGT